MDKSRLQHLADLSALALTDEELDRLGAQMQQIVALMDGIRNAPVAEASAVHGQEYANLREDIAAASLPRQSVLENSKSTDGSYFTLPQVVD